VEGANALGDSVWLSGVKSIDAIDSLVFYLFYPRVREYASLFANTML
jgi:hypothetical protein